MDTKLCSHCKLDKTLDNFFPIKGRPGHYSSWCRECLKWNSQRYASSERGKQVMADYRKSEARRQVLLKYNVSDKRQAVQQRYYLTGKPKEYQERKKQTDPQHKLKKASEAKARAARIKGIIVALPCEFSGTGDCHGRIEMHHDDYSKPLDIRWVCARHHHMIGVGRLA